MKWIYLLPLVLIISSRSLGQDANAMLKEKILQLDKLHAQAIFRGDSLGLDSLMDDEVTVNHPTNRVVKEKKELLELIRKGTIRYTAFDRRQETVLFFENMVVVMGNETVVPAPGAPGEGITIERRYTNVWMHKNGKWRLAIRHAHNICP